LSRLEKDQSGIELMNSVKGEFVNLSEELTDDAVSIEDIDEVLQTLERATSSEAEIEEPLIEESSSAAESDEGMNEEVELDLSAGEMDKTSDPIRVYMREMGVVPRGLGLALWRLLRCNPWSLGGVDDVPPVRGAHTHAEG
jgi:hypothetical protein